MLQIERAENELAESRQEIERLNTLTINVIPVKAGRSEQVKTDRDNQQDNEAEM